MSFTTIKHNNSNMKTTTVTLNNITKNFKGMFIGKSGCNIKNIKFEFFKNYNTKCYIDVQDNEII